MKHFKKSKPKQKVKTDKSKQVSSCLRLQPVDRSHETLEYLGTEYAELERKYRKENKIKWLANGKRKRRKFQNF